ncbi:hypothetical protein [Ideonella sp. YS5]|uniref:hypothetical protein n=1 Tax=Ideonella sp. YS5 TaxID=3453714 RepID=UPI003EEB7503
MAARPAASSSARIESAIPSASQPGGSKRAYTPEQQFRNRLRKAWTRLATDHGRLLASYQRAFGAKKNGPDLLQALIDATREPGARALVTGVPQVAHFVIKLGAQIPAAQVLCWTDADGTVADVKLARSDQPGHVEQAARELLAAARNRHSVNSATEEGGATRTHLRQLWQRRSGQELDPITEAWHRLPGNALTADFHVLEYLHGLTKEAGARALPTDGAGIQRFIVKVPGIAEPVDILLREQPDGTLGDLRFAPEKKEKLPWLVRLMEQGEATSIQRKTAAPRQGPRNANSLWAPLKNRLAAAFEACREARREKNERVPAAGAFVKHLDELCLATGEGVLVDADLDVRRFVVTPEGSNHPITLLRRADERGVAALRVVEPDLSDQAAMLKDIWRHARKTPAGAAPASSASAMAADAPGPAAAPSGSGRAMKDAWQLKQVLEVAVANQGRGGDLLAGAAEASGVPDRELRRWVGPDGALLLTPGALLKLKDYYDLRDDFEILFTQLGQPQSVAKLPGELTAEMTLRMLKARQELPDAPTSRLARRADIHPEVAKRYFDAHHEVFFKASNERLMRMPDYARHRAAMQAALAAIGHTERAANLPAPETPAETFLRQFEERLYPLRMAIGQMRRDPALSATQAARLVNAWPEMPALLDRLVLPGGQLRAVGDIARDLPAFEADQRPLLEQLLARIAPGAAGAGMTEELMPAKGLAPGKVFIVRDPSGAADGRAGSREGKAARGRRLEQIYANSPAQVVPPRSYRAERPKQCLRWLSTFLKARFDKATEVQAYWDAPRGELWVSSNHTAANADIKAFLEQGGLARALEDLVEDTHASREVRHASRLRQMMKDESARPVQAGPLLAALFDGQVRVPTDAIIDNRTGHRIELHAERHLKHAFEKLHGEGSLDRRLVAGTMRPCGICAKDLKLPASARRGPFWMSRAATQGHDLVAHAEHDRDAGIGTYATRTRDGKLTVAYDTDSDDGTDIEDSALGKRHAEDRAGDAGKAPRVKRR